MTEVDISKVGENAPKVSTKRILQAHAVAVFKGRLEPKTREIYDLLMNKAIQDLKQVQISILAEAPDPVRAVEATPEFING